MRGRSVASRYRCAVAAMAAAALATGLAALSAAAASPDPAPTTATASPSIAPATRIEGRVTWNATTTSRVSPDFSDVWNVSGTMDLVLDVDLGQFMALPGKSTYAYDLEHVGCSPATHEVGTLETSIQTFADDGVGQALIFGAVDDEVEMSMFFDDEWMVTCPPGFSSSESVAPTAFPGCAPPRADMVAIRDSTGTYHIACDIDVEIGLGSGVTGRIEGSLSPVPAPSGSQVNHG